MEYTITITHNPSNSAVSRHSVDRYTLTKQNGKLSIIADLEKTLRKKIADCFPAPPHKSLMDKIMEEIEK